MNRNKYLAAVVAVGIAVVTAVAQTADGVVHPAGLVQLALVTVGAIGVYLAPVLPGGWQAGAKVAVAVLTAGLSAVAPFVVAGHITGVQTAVVILAVLQAVGAQVGVDARLDDETGRVDTINYQDGAGE